MLDGEGESMSRTGASGIRVLELILVKELLGYSPRHCLFLVLLDLPHLPCSVQRNTALLPWAWPSISKLLF